MTTSTPPRSSDRGAARTRRARVLSVATLTVAALVAGSALAVAGSSSAKKATEVGQTGASPVPVVSTVQGKTKFRIASFNILGYDHTAPGGTKRGYADGAKRMRWAIQSLKSNKVDVVGLQEFQPEQYDKWVKRASGTYDIWPGYTDTEGFLRNSIAWRKDAFSMVSNTWVKLPYFKGDVLRMPVALLRSNLTGQQFYVMNFQNPADVRGNAAQWRLTGQRWQIALVNQLRASNNLPILWVGDMNAKNQVFCRVTSQAGMIAANGGSNDAAGCKPPSKMVVDWIFGSGVKFKKYSQLRDRKIVRTTDHHLISAKVVMNPTSATVPPPPLPVATCTTTTPTGTPYATTTPSITYSTPTPATPPVVPSPTPTPVATTYPTVTVTPTLPPVTACLTTTPLPVIFSTVPPKY
jgi:endonuclease/exonuclease/phosphatase family metal-dependent hydrolase